jgi:very-short-patch-repair endonuclease
LRGVKFRRQYILRGFVLDFYCPDFKLGIELDGAIHNKQRDYDKARDDLIKDLGITIIRINNEDIINNVDEMLSKVEDHLIINNIKQGASKRVLPLHGNGEGDRG